MSSEVCKRTLSIIFAVIVVAGIACSPAYANTQNDYAVNNVLGSISVTENTRSYTDISNVEIEVYSMLQSAVDEFGTEYTHEYEFSVYPDENGNFYFDKPSQYCYVSLDLSTIQEGFGVNSNAVVIEPSVGELNFEISEIVDFNVDISNDNVTFYDDFENELSVEKNFDLDYESNLNNSVINKDYVNASCDFSNIELQGKVDLSAASKFDKVNLLYDKNKISLENKLNRYCEMIINNELDESELTSALAYIAEYQQDTTVSSATRANITEAQNSQIPEFTNEATYVRGYFTIHYESGDVTNEDLRKIYNQLYFTKSSLCSTFEFLTPRSSSDDTTYQVYINTKETENIPSGKAVPYKSEDGSFCYSFIVIYLLPQTSTNETALDNYKLGTITHEFMHAIQFAYAPYNTVEDTINFYESVANSAGVHLVDNSLIYQNINTFLDSPELSLFSNGIKDSNGNYVKYNFRSYGAALFPLYIEQNYSSFNTIRMIYEEYNRCDNNIYEAIDNVLNRSGGSLTDDYVNFMVWNYDVRSNYNKVETEWKNTAKKTAFTTTSKSYSLPKLASMYFEKAGSGSGLTKTFTFGLQNNTQTSTVSLKSIFTGTNGTVTVRDRNFTSNTRTVTYVLNAGAKVCFLISNKTTDKILDFYTFVQ